MAANCFGVGEVLGMVSRDGSELEDEESDDELDNDRSVKVIWIRIWSALPSVKESGLTFTAMLHAFAAQ